MKKKNLALTLLWAAGLNGWAAARENAAAGKCDVIRTISIRLINDAAVKPKVVIAAQQEAAWVLESLCVEIEWAARSSTTAPEVRIIVGPLGPGVTERALGITILGADLHNRGAVFFPRVRAMEEVYGYLIDLGRLLGCVLAHEIGHLLLGTTAHSSEGVMIKNFGEAEVQRAAQRRLIFTGSNREMFSGSEIVRRLSTKKATELSAK